VIAVDTNVLVRLFIADEPAQAVKALRALASHATVALESATAVRSAADAFEKGPADFADCLSSMKAQAAGCDRLATFDRGM
jgi:predicted nucleic-acid-binding protein